MNFLRLKQSKIFVAYLRQKLIYNVFCVLTNAYDLLPSHWTNHATVCLPKHSSLHSVKRYGKYLNLVQGYAAILNLLPWLTSQKNSCSYHHCERQMFWPLKSAGKRNRNTQNWYICRGGEIKHLLKIMFGMYVCILNLRFLVLHIAHEDWAQSKLTQLSALF